MGYRKHILFIPTGFEAGKPPAKARGPAKRKIKTRGRTARRQGKRRGRRGAARPTPGLKICLAGLPEGGLSGMFCDANGISLYYERSGRGRPLILLHGNGEDHQIFDALVPGLADRFAVYAVDSRNHGRSRRAADCGYDAMAEDIHALIRALGLGRADLVGFSDGAIVALLLALRHGEAVRRMALLGVNLKPEDFTEEGLAAVQEEYRRTGDPLCRLMLEQPRIELDQLRAVDVPTLVVGAERDVFRPETFSAVAAALPRARLLMMEGHDHGSYLVRRDILGETLLDFFAPADRPSD